MKMSNKDKKKKKKIITFKLKKYIDLNVQEGLHIYSCLGEYDVVQHSY